MRNDLLSFRKAEKENKTRETVAATTVGTQVKVPQKERSAGTSPLIRESIKRSRNKDGIQLGVVMVSFGGVVGEKALLEWAYTKTREKLVNRCT